MDEKKELLIKAAIKGVREYGLNGVPMQRIAKMSGINASTIYTHFTSKEELMWTCFEYVDDQISELFLKADIDTNALAEDPNAVIRQLWMTYFRWLIDHPDETIFYYHYRDSPAFLKYDAGRQTSLKPFENLFNCIEQISGAYNVISLRLISILLLNGTTMYAKQIIEGALPDTPATHEYIFRLQMSGLSGILTAGLTGQDQIDVSEFPVYPEKRAREASKVSAAEDGLPPRDGNGSPS